MRKLLIISLVLLLSVVMLGLNEAQVRELARSQARDRVSSQRQGSFFLGGLVPIVVPLIICFVGPEVFLQSEYPL